MALVQRARIVDDHRLRTEGLDLTVSVLIIDDDKKRAAEVGEALDEYDFSHVIIHQAAAGIGAFLSGNYDIVCLAEDGFGGKGRRLAKGVRGCSGGDGVGLVLWGASENHEKDDIADETWAKGFSISEYPQRLAALAQKRTGASCNDIAIEGVLPLHRLGGDNGPGSGTIDLFADLEDVIVSESSVFPEKVPAEGELGDTFSVRNLLLYFGRKQATGVLAMNDSEGCISIAFSRGFIVGASDTSLQDPIGARLVRKKIVTPADVERGMQQAAKHGIRLAEALLQIGILDAHTLLQELEAQAKARASRAVGLDNGTFHFDAAIEGVERLSLTPMDVTDILLTWFLRESDKSVIQAWRDECGEAAIRYPSEHPAGAHCFRKHRSGSVLATKLSSREFKTVSGLIKYAEDVSGGDPRSLQKSLQEIFACASSGVFFVEGDIGYSETAMPLLVQVGQDEGAVDRILAVLVQSTWLRCQGKNFFEVLEVDTTSDEDELRESFDLFCESIQLEKISQANLGPVTSLASSLRGLCSEIEFVLFDKDARKEYVEQISGTKEEPSPKASVKKSKASKNAKSSSKKPKISKAEVMAGLDAAEAAMTSGENQKALEVLEKLGGAKAQFVSVRANTFATEATIAYEEVLKNIDHLRQLREKAPRNVRVLYLLGRTLLQVGQPAEAMDCLSKAAKLVPDDTQVKEAIEEAVGKIVAANDLV